MKKKKLFFIMLFAFMILGMKKTDVNAQDSIYIGKSDSKSITFSYPWGTSSNIGFRSTDTSVATCTCTEKLDTSDLSNIIINYTVTITGKNAGTASIERYNVSDNTVYESFEVIVDSANFLLCVGNTKTIGLTTTSGGGFSYTCDQTEGYSCLYTGYNSSTVNSSTTYTFKYLLSFTKSGEYQYTFTHNQTGEVLSCVVRVNEHCYENPTVLSESTCFRQGQTQYTCKYCGSHKIELMDLTDHSWNSEYTIDKEATCNTEGVKSIHCSVCNALKDGSEIQIPATGNHTWDNGIVSLAPTETAEGIRTYTCTVCRQTKEESITRLTHEKGLHHDAVAATCISKGTVEYWDCKNCDGKLDESGNLMEDISMDIDSSNHTGNTELKKVSSATCKNEGYTGDVYCKDCGVKISDGQIIPRLTTHTWNAGSIIKEATVFEEGIKAFTCTVCGNTETLSVPKLTPTISLSKTKVTLKKKKSITIKVANLAAGDSVKSWKSTKKKVASVNAKGKIKAKKKGRTTIIVTLASGKTASVKVTVK